MGPSLHEERYQGTFVSNTSGRKLAPSRKKDGQQINREGRPGGGPVVRNWLHSLRKLTEDDASLLRLSAHLVMILLAILAFSLGNVRWVWGRLIVKQPSSEILARPAVVEPIKRLAQPAELKDASNDIIVRAAVPHTIIPQRARQELSTYVVEPGDTVSGIAARFGLAPETIIWANGSLEDNPELLQVGQELIILPLNGVYHQVGGSDTIESIAATYQADPAAIVASPLNGLDPDDPVIQPGQWLVVPGGQKPFVPRTVIAYSASIPAGAVAGSGAFGWPASGSITQDYWSGHPGLDIAAPRGTPVFAADAGYVAAVGWDDTGYGYMVVIDHGNGFQTLYAHLETYSVEVGDNVTKGQQIGGVGSSGNSTGPHVHFEVRQGTVQRNPFGFLP